MLSSPGFVINSGNLRDLQLEVCINVIDIWFQLLTELYLIDMNNFSLSSEWQEPFVYWKCSWCITQHWKDDIHLQCPLTTGTVRQQFTSLRGTTWRNNWSCTRNGSSFEHHGVFWVENTSIHEVKLKISCCYRDKDQSVGIFINTMHLGFS